MSRSQLACATFGKKFAEQKLSCVSGVEFGAGEMVCTHKQVFLNGTLYRKDNYLSRRYSIWQLRRKADNKPPNFVFSFSSQLPE
jgi:hypothetical protein